MKRSTLALLVLVLAFVMGIADPIVSGVKQAGVQASNVVCGGSR